MTSPRQLIAALAILALAACAERSVHSGRVPENLTREHLQEKPATERKPDRQTAYDLRMTETVGRDPTVENPEAAQARVGVAGTHVFHRLDCEIVKDVPAADLVRFTSPWDGVDAQFSPCEHCHAMK
jgi:hypothetical protein